MRTLLAVLALLLSACGGAPAQPMEPSQSVPPRQPAAAEPEAPASPSPEDQEPAQADRSDDCVEQCVTARQMQATSAEVIREQCESECEAAAVSP